MWGGLENGATAASNETESERKFSRAIARLIPRHPGDPNAALAHSAYLRIYALASTPRLARSLAFFHGKRTHLARRSSTGLRIQGSTTRTASKITRGDKARRLVSYIIVLPSLLPVLLLSPPVFSHFRRKKEVNTDPCIPLSHLVLSRPSWPDARDGTYHLTLCGPEPQTQAGRRSFRGKIITEVRRTFRAHP